ncbi:purine hydroxylase delta subunit apoprotein [Proteiniborus ethanoligenes]|uniref:Purine hydroxylase delta subunit apoprotein n=1 Tax=Proteiniborus ethanoligenes TaxID=415015 RepID=A0A1H3NH55_9FIRM|nr:(2Fe-2S)-binding protein [Proteiniborus ethanoligenes]SDY88178.1 purine hydroxylase delta subunit apoprotein [Proteiniborus ethanoligenes]
MKTIELNVNRKTYRVEVEEDMRLIDVLRDKLGLIGTKEGCGEGECGACTVIMDGEAVASCLVMGFQAEGSEIVTIEGLGDENGIDPIQQAFLDEGAVQCGFCIPGMVLSAKSLLDKNSSPTRKDIREAISGNLCRCTGYNKIVNAVEKAAKDLQGGK